MIARRKPRPTPVPHLAAVAQTAFDLAVLRIYNLPLREQDAALTDLVDALTRIDGPPAVHPHAA